MKLCQRCGKAYGATDYRCQLCGYAPQKIQEFVAFAPELAEGGAGFEAAYFERLSKLEPKSFWFNARNELLTWALGRYFPDAGSFFEIGCGTGFVLSGLAKKRPDMTLVGSEVFLAGLSIAAQRVPKAELFQMDARRIPFADHFDVIGAFDVLEHIQEDEEVLLQMRHAVRKGGGIMITVPQHPFLWSKSDSYAHHVRRYRLKELKSKVKKAGFDIVRLTSFVSLLLPFMIAARWKQRCRAEFSAGAEFEIPSWVDRVFRGIMSLERGMIRGGLSFPAGGSLLLVGQGR